MPRSKAARPTETAQALAIRETTLSFPATARRLGKAWLESLEGLDTIEDANGLAGVVIHNEKQHELALQAQIASKEFEKAVKAATEPDARERKRKLHRKLAMALITKGTKLVSDAALKFRDAEAKRVEAEARAQAEKDRKAALKQQESDAKKLERSAKRTKDPEKKRQLEELAEETRSEPIQSVDAAVGEAVKEQQQSWRGTGKGSTRDNWSAEVLDLSKVPRKYLVIDQPAINAVARDKEAEDIGIPGVRGVNNRTLART